MTYRKKLIEVALPLKAINEASVREKSIRHGHPLHYTSGGHAAHWQLVGPYSLPLLLMILPHTQKNFRPSKSKSENAIGFSN